MNVISVITSEWCPNLTALVSDVALAWGLASDGGWLCWLEDGLEEAVALVFAGAVVGVHAVVEAPDCGVAALALGDELWVELMESSAGQHLLLLCAHAI